MIYFQGECSFTHFEWEIGRHVDRRGGVIDWVSTTEGFVGSFDVRKLKALRVGQLSKSVWTRISLRLNLLFSLGLHRLMLSKVFVTTWHRDGLADNGAGSMVG